MKLHVKQLGTGSPLILFHGWGFNHQIWLRLASRLQSEYSVFLIDLPGFGASSALSLEQFEHQLLAFLPPQATLIGWSLGGLFASHFALKHPKRVKQLLNVASTPYFLRSNDWPGIKRCHFDHFTAEFTQNPKNVLDSFLDLPASSAAYKQSCLAQEDLSKSDHLIAYLTLLGRWDLRKEISKLTIPTYYLFGRYDRIIPPNVCLKMKKYYPQFHYKLFSLSGHAPFISEEDAFINFLKDIIQPKNAAYIF